MMRCWNDEMIRSPWWPLRLGILREKLYFYFGKLSNKKLILAANFGDTSFHYPLVLEQLSQTTDLLPSLEDINPELYRRFKEATQDDELIELLNNHSSAWKESFMETYYTEAEYTFQSSNYVNQAVYFSPRNTEQDRPISYRKGNYKHQFPSECPKCGKGFSQPGGMMRHYKYKHEGVKYSCDHCGKHFTTQHSLRGHIRSIHAWETSPPIPH